ncbi:copper-binding protein [Sneathiella sp. P13V-1]|uniref:cupredoxin domain-containing protein n=1 Tax=Sneathiella sp. P13V-1 TaxID=2697366 RepID=UPI00187BAF70|nr:cupredoxin family copper-binding protein [Sneathiella sp. P13V-1]MBE7637881.1 copper-binding protein [Sneathiella sp. P13V-1]
MQLNLIVRKRELGGLLVAAASSLLFPSANSIASPNGQVHQVMIKKFKFDPATLEIKAGDTVEWINLDLAPHTATDTDDRWDSDDLNKGMSARIKFEKQGDFSYLCRFHPSMRGKVKVLPHR